MNPYERIKEDLSRMNFLVDAIKKSQDKEYIKEAKKLRKDIKIQLNTIKEHFEQSETSLLDAITEDDNA